MPIPPDSPEATKEATKLTGLLDKHDDNAFQMELNSLSPKDQLSALQALKKQEAKREAEYAGSESKASTLAHVDLPPLHEVKIDLLPGHKPSVSTVDVPAKDIGHGTEKALPHHAIALDGKAAAAPHDKGPTPEQLKAQQLERERQEEAKKAAETARIAALEGTAGDNVKLLRSGDATKIAQFSDMYSKLSPADQGLLGRAMEKDVAAHSAPGDTPLSLQHGPNGEIEKVSLQHFDEHDKNHKHPTMLTEWETQEALKRDSSVELTNLRKSFKPDGSVYQAGVDAFWQHYNSLAPNLQKQAADLMYKDNLDYRTDHTTDPHKLSIEVDADGIASITTLDKHGKTVTLQESKGAKKLWEATKEATKSRIPIR